MALLTFIHFEPVRISLLEVPVMFRAASADQVLSSWCEECGHWGWEPGLPCSCLPHCFSRFLWSCFTHGPVCPCIQHTQPFSTGSLAANLGTKNRKRWIMNLQSCLYCTGLTGSMFIFKRIWNSNPQIICIFQIGRWLLQSTTGWWLNGNFLSNEFTNTCYLTTNRQRDYVTLCDTWHRPCDVCDVPSGVLFYCWVWEQFDSVLPWLPSPHPPLNPASARAGRPGFKPSVL